MFNRRGTPGQPDGRPSDIAAGGPRHRPSHQARPTRESPDGSDRSPPLWPGDAPGSAGVTVVETVVDRTTAGGLPDRAVTHTRKPTLTVFRPAKPNGAAVVLMPGGGVRARGRRQGRLRDRPLAGRPRLHLFRPALPPAGRRAGARGPTFRCRTPSAACAWRARRPRPWVSTPLASRSWASRPADTWPPA